VDNTSCVEGMYVSHIDRRRYPVMPGTVIQDHTIVVGPPRHATYPDRAGRRRDRPNIPLSSRALIHLT
jgi:hypothetical protein